MKVSEYIIDFLVAQGIKKVFIVTGGAVAFIVDSFHGRKDIEYVCVAHEQAGAIMAESYSRMGPGYAATMVTSGPGATNLITGIGCAWFDSIPVIHISGQVNTFEQKGTMKVRQVGFQETDIVSIIKPITKYAKQIKRAEDIRFELEKATYMAKSGRPGPVLLDIPMNFQRTIINPKKLKSFRPPIKKEYEDTGTALKKKILKAVKLIKEAERPVILTGGGVRLSMAMDQIYTLSKITKFPVTASWSGYDIFPRSNNQYLGAHGVYGERAANFAVQNSDVLISVGSRLDTRQTGGKPETFARESRVIMVDIDKGELNKRRGLTPTLSIQCDAKEFLMALILELKKQKLKDVSPWLIRCQDWKNRYPVVLPEYYKQKGSVNAYVFVKTLSEELGNDAVVIPDDGGHLTWTMQAFEVKQGQRVFSAYGNSPMGYAFPASIGASFALNKKPIICIDGDGSIQMNIQELQTLVYHKLPVKLFILNNQGYGIIKQFQELYLNSHYEATGKGYSCPDFIKIGKAYGLKTVSIVNHKELRRKIRHVMRIKGPVLCDVRVHEFQKLIPKLEFGRPIEDLSPLLPRKEFFENMIIKPLSTTDKPKIKIEVNEIN